MSCHVLHCCTSNRCYTQCSFTVSTAVAGQGTSCPLDNTENSTWGQLHRRGALLTHSYPEADNAHYCLLSGLTAPSLPLVCMLGVCVYVGERHSTGFESHCDDQETEAHYSNAHLIAKEKRFYLHQPRKTSNSD